MAGSVPISKRGQERMAKLIPSLNSCLSRMTAGEKRFARRLESYLEDSYSCWYDIPIGRRQKYSDFIVLHPAKGLLLLEVKDWKFDTIRSANRLLFELLTGRGPKTAMNPIEQVRQCTYLLVNRLREDPELVHRAGRYQGNLLFPYGFGVVLTNITRKQFDKAGLGEVVPPHQVICRDEMTETVDPEAFQKRLWDMFNTSFTPSLTQAQVDRIRWHLFPEIRIAPYADSQSSLWRDENATSATDAAARVPDIVKVMDLEQEKLARNLGTGHRVIHGVAGSGKTMILVYRCLYLASVLNKRILVVCFNITLAAHLRALVEKSGMAEKIEAHHFHDWCGAQVRAHGLHKPRPGDDYHAELVRTLIEGMGRGQVPKGQYRALLIDEGHDFEAEWLRLLVQTVDPDDGSLLLLYDDAQSIYDAGGRICFSLSSVGIQARGRTKILKTNYRNTDEILEFAYRFASQYLEPSEGDDDHIPLVEPQGAGREGPPPHFRELPTQAEERAYIGRALMTLNRERGHAWRDMLIACHSRHVAEKLCQALRQQNIPAESVIHAQQKKSLNLASDTVKVMTMHSSKGLEFPVVVIPEIDKMPRKDLTPTAEAKLLYVAMTRCTDKLLITASARSGFAEHFV